MKPRSIKAMLKAIRDHVDGAWDLLAPGGMLIYQWRAADGRVVYVGITKDPAPRAPKPGEGERGAWYQEMSRTHREDEFVSAFPMRLPEFIARIVETILIWSHRPRFNKQHNPDYRAPRGPYIRMPEAVSIHPPYAVAT
jgi:hypothetical protein